VQDLGIGTVNQDAVADPGQDRLDEGFKTHQVGAGFEFRCCHRIGRKKLSVAAWWPLCRKRGLRAAFIRGPFLV